MKPSPSDIARFRASLGRATRSPDFLERFYRRFVGSSEEIAAVFRNKDMARIQRKLAMTLEMVDDHAAGEPGLDMYLQMLGGIHARMHIPPGGFRLWRDALIETAAESDPELDAGSRASWEAVIDDLIEKMGGSA